MFNSLFPVKQKWRHRDCGQKEKEPNPRSHRKDRLGIEVWSMVAGQWVPKKLSENPPEENKAQGFPRVPRIGA